MIVDGIDFEWNGMTLTATLSGSVIESNNYSGNVICGFCGTPAKVGVSTWRTRRGNTIVVNTKMGCECGRKGSTVIGNDAWAILEAYFPGTPRYGLTVMLENYKFVDPHCNFGRLAL